MHGFDYLVTSLDCNFLTVPILIFFFVFVFVFFLFLFFIRYLNIQNKTLGN